MSNTRKRKMSIFLNAGKATKNLLSWHLNCQWHHSIDLHRHNTWLLVALQSSWVALHKVEQWQVKCHDFLLLNTMVVYWNLKGRGGNRDLPRQEPGWITYRINHLTKTCWSNIYYIVLHGFLKLFPIIKYCSSQNLCLVLVL